MTALKVKLKVVYEEQEQSVEAAKEFERRASYTFAHLVASL